MQRMVPRGHRSRAPYIENDRGARAGTMDFQAGDVGYVRQILAHYIENTADEDLRFFEMFKASRYEDISLSEWLSHAPPKSVMTHLNVDKTTYDAIAREKPIKVIAPASGLKLCEG